MKRDLARELFRSYRTRVFKNETPSEERTGKDEPERISAILDELTNARDWRRGLAEGNLFTKWSEVVGADLAAHCEPVTLYEGKLTIRAESTAWATQLRLLSEELLKTIRSRSEGALVEQLQIIGPTAPSWKRGLRTIKGARGPRDTYG